ncbi:zinc permease [Apibacter muscae]|uniref:Zinc permease n=1 Tax=Apibacter muscae TaxID=2509004 RepID=A0A563DEU7_9FLAO|nr:ZIP family metal transporter [Apibacter muscae]TWP28730.1 zinc permease [Apibacter muscae]
MEYVVLIVAVIIGAIIAYFFQNNHRFSKKLLMFSAGLLLAITVLDMFPTLYSSHEKVNAGLWVIVGVFLQLLLEGLSKGIEHGHVHTHSHGQVDSIVPLSVMLGLFIHSFLEGAPIEAHHHGHSHEHSNILWALSIHKISETIVLSTFVFSLKIKNLYKFLILVLFAISAPIGTLVGSIIPNKYFPEIIGIVSGIFLHISSVIIFESNEKHNLNFQKLFLVFMGMLVGYLITLG